MMKRQFGITAAMFFFALTAALAQQQTIYQHYNALADSMLNRYARWNYTGADTLSNPYYISAFSAPTLFQGTLRRTLNLHSTAADAAEPYSRKAKITAEAIDRQLIAIYSNKPWTIAHNEYDQTSSPVRGLRHELDKKTDPKLELADNTVKAEGKLPQDKVLDIDPQLTQFDIVTHKPKFWTLKSNINLQFMQNHISDNWYKGGESYNSLLTEVKIFLNYNNKQRISFENTLEMKLGFYSSRSDTVHRYKTNSDLIRLINKLGIQASKHWYYTVMLQSWTQFCPGYKSNNKKVFSDFLSPFEGTASVGMNYKLETNNKRFKLGVIISPFACNLKYVDRKALSKSFGVDEGKNTKWTWGSNITADATWEVTKQIKWTSRFYWFSDYDKTQIEWENTIKMQINKLLKTTIFLYPRYDDSSFRTENDNHFQFKEYLSVGIGIEL